MEGGSVPGETTQLLEQPRSLPEDREAVIQACYELVCSGRSLSEILTEARRLSAAETTATIVDTCGEIRTAGAPCAGASQSEKIQTADPSHSLGSPQPEVPSRMERCSRWPAVGLVAAACAIAAVGISRISVWPLPVEGRRFQTVASETQRQPSPGFPAQAAVARVDVPTTSATPVEAGLAIDASLTSTAATSAFEEPGGNIRYNRIGTSLDKPNADWLRSRALSHDSGHTAMSGIASAQQPFYRPPASPVSVLARSGNMID